MAFSSESARIANKVRWLHIVKLKTHLGFSTDRDMADRVRQAAAKNRVTVSEQLRIYIEWGLEADGVASV